ncbi:helix-turn-helix domain-containing protein [Streptomyces sp. XY413]|uniref:helix-turn-helix domain-containing protein n=1 Tax=Streptomyces sp. XY413 TaxID=1519479 RepID=UPI00131BD577
MSPRTLQRRLRELGPTWREEVESVRQERTMELLRTTEVPLQVIAARVGYSDMRARCAGRYGGGTGGRPGTSATRRDSRRPPLAAVADAPTSWGTWSSPRACRP